MEKLDKDIGDLKEILKRNGEHLTLIPSPLR